MNAEELAAARGVVDALNRDDLEAMARFVTGDVEAYPLRAQLEGGSYRGLAGLGQMGADLRGDWEDLSFEITEEVEAPDGAVVIGRLRGRGRTSGAPVDVTIGWHFRFRDARIAYARSYSDPAEALRAAGVDFERG